MNLRVPDGVASAAVARGAGGWLRDLPGLIVELEAECDLGVMMRNDPLELLDGYPWARAPWLAERCGLDATAIWEWGVVERVTSGLGQVIGIVVTVSWKETL